MIEVTSKHLFARWAGLSTPWGQQRAQRSWGGMRNMFRCSRCVDISQLKVSAFERKSVILIQGKAATSFEQGSRQQAAGSSSLRTDSRRSFKSTSSSQVFRLNGCDVFDLRWSSCRCGPCSQRSALHLRHGPESAQHGSTAALLPCENRRQ